MDKLYRWSKFILPDEETLWETKMMLDEVAFSIESIVNRKKSRIEAFCQTRREAEELKEKHGGGVTEILPEHWAPTIDPAEARVLRIRDQFIVSETDDAASLDQLAKENPGREILSFPPQLAFGTGGHPTTANCLRFLVDASTKQPPAWKFLDLGCGSGILSVAAAKLGSEKVVAVEFDEGALEYAKLNGERHEVSRNIKFVHADVLDLLKTPPNEPYDIIAANLFANLLVEILPMLNGWLKPGGELILSGFLTSQTKEVNDKAGECGFPLKQFLRRGKWVAAASN